MLCHTSRRDRLSSGLVCLHRNTLLMLEHSGPQFCKMAVTLAEACIACASISRHTVDSHKWGTCCDCLNLVERGHVKLLTLFGALLEQSHAFSM